ncbi:MAG TPA: DUF188 domain-containing protein [Firmicutes bacterium]|nr:DUF188 domain-containing protein [Bacillota bacterium]
MRILIDADGCPVVNLALEAGRRRGVPVLLFCDTAHIFSREGAETITVSKGADSVDFALVGRLQPGDIVVTQDYGLAAMCLAKGGRPVSQDGLLFTPDNMDGLLQSRYETKRILAAGGRVKGPKKRRSEQDDAFRQALERLLEGV